MLTRILRLLREQTLGALALFVALSGTAYAATALPRNSVGPAQLKTGAVRSVDVGDRSLLKRDFRAGQLPAGPRGPRGLRGLRGAAGPAALGLRTPLFNDQTRQLGSIGGFGFSTVCSGESGSTEGYVLISGTGSATVARFTQLNDDPPTTTLTHIGIGGDTGVIGMIAGPGEDAVQAGSLRLWSSDSDAVLTVDVQITTWGPGSAPGCEVAGTAVLGLPPS